jgi:AraC-like DNA-binding protein
MQTSGILVNHVRAKGLFSGDARACLHHHENLYEIMVMNEGQVTQVQPDGSCSTMKPGDITFSPPRVPHGSFGSEGRTSEWYLIYIHERVLKDMTHVLFRPMTECLSLMDEQAKEDFFLVRSVRNFDTLLELLKDMLTESRQQWNNQQEQLQLLLGQWFHWLLRDRRFSRMKLVQEEPHPHSRWMADSLQYMQTQFNRPDLGVQEVMGRLPMSRSLFFQVFKKEVGHTFSDHLNELRLSEASRLLKESQLPITDILYRVGYQNPSHFGHRFKKRFGHSPREYRNQHHQAS